MKAFVTDGDQRPALAITRSLGRRGISVLVGEERPSSLASSSRYCVRHVTYPSPYGQPEAFDRFLLDFVERERIDVVVPATDVTTYWIAGNQDAIRRRSSVAVPPFDAFDFVTNKWALLQRAAECGITIPRTYFVDGGDSLPAVIGELEYPAVVKSVRSRIRTITGWLPTTVHYAYCESDLLRRYRDTDYLASYPSLIQERIVGGGIGVFVLCSRGQLVAAFAHRRLRERPPSGGVSVLCESLALDPHLQSQAMRLLGPLGWHGVAMLEYKQDSRTGQYVLMEVNGRFWGSLQLAVDAGIDFPYLSCRLALGQPLDVPMMYEAGVRSHWLLGDLDHLLLRLFRSDRDLPDFAPSKLGAVVDFVRSAARGSRNEVFRRDDPGPALCELWAYAKTLSASAVHLVRKPVVRVASASMLPQGVTTRRARRTNSSVS